MSIDTLIQWCDDTVNPVMGCTAPCELRPTPNQARAATVMFLKSWFPQASLESLTAFVEEELGAHNATEIYQLRNETICAAYKTFDEPMRPSVAGQVRYKRALDAVYICYAHQITLMKSSDITKPAKWAHPGFPIQFERPLQFPNRMANAAMRPDLFRKTSRDKPWLNFLPRIFFVSDMADALSEQIPYIYLKQEIIDVVSTPRGRQHIWLWLTKMPKRMAEFGNWLATQGITWPDNLVAMTSVTSKKTIIRAEQLKKVPARFKGLSVEPLWEDVRLNLSEIDWCVVGGQSGNASRPFDLSWARNLQTQCRAAGAAFVVKQLGAAPVDNGVSISLKDQHGGDWSEWPRNLRYREMPKGFHALRFANPISLVALTSTQQN